MVRDRSREVLWDGGPGFGAEQVRSPWRGSWHAQATRGKRGLVVDGSLWEAGKHQVAGRPISAVMPVPCIHGCHSLPHSDPVTQIQIGDTGGTVVSFISVGLRVTLRSSRTGILC